MSAPLELTRFRSKGRLIAALSFLALAGFLAWLGYLDYRGTEQDLQQLLQANAATLTESLVQATRLSQASFDALRREIAGRLLATARLVRHLDGERPLTQEDLRQLTRLGGVLHVHVFDPAGRRILTSSAGPGTGLGGDPSRVLEPILEQQVSELVIGLRENRFGSGQRFAVAVRRESGGAIVVTAAASDLPDRLESVQLGKVLSGLADHLPIAYVIVQDPDGPVSATPGVQRIDPIAEVPALRDAWNDRRPRHRFTWHQGKEILEWISSFELESDYRVLFRVGVNLAFYRQALSDVARRDLLLGLAVLLGSGILLTLLQTAQNYRFLRSRYLQSLALSDRIMENTSEAVLLLDGAGRVVRSNPQAERLLGLRPGELALERLAALFPEGAAQETVNAGIYFRLEERQFLGVVQPFEAGSAEPGGSSWLVQVRDVTRLREMEERQEREERLVGLGRLVAAVAHEIRNPLNAISLSVQTLQRRLQASGEESAGANLRMIREEVSRLDRLVEDLLGYARPGDLQLQPVELGKVLDKLRVLFQETLGAQGVEWRQESAVGTPWPTLQADEEKLTRVLLNLLRNSLQAMTGAGWLSWRWSREDGHGLLQLHDGGPGFSPQALARAREPFFSTRPQGSGLGLFISHEIARRHGWTLDLDNHPAGGALVTIRIPLSDPMTGGQGPPDRREPGPVSATDASRSAEDA